MAGRTPPHPVPQRPSLGGWVAHFETAPRCTTLTFAPQVMETLLFSTFVSWKVFFPLVRDGRGCTYTFMTGASCLDAPPPHPPRLRRKPAISVKPWFERLCHRRSRGEAADARHGFPDPRSRQLLGFLPGAAGGIPRGGLQAQPGNRRQRDPPPLTKGKLLIFQYVPIKLKCLRR